MPAELDTPAAVPAAAKPLTVIADDYGMAAGVDRAVLALARAGRLSGTSVLSLGRHWGHSAAWLRDLPGFQVGLHVDLPPGHDRLEAALLQAWLRLLGGKRLAAHLDAQFDAFEQHHGRRPDYLDGHRHVHQWPVLRDLILEHWSRRYSEPPRWARVTRPAPAVPFEAKAETIFRLGGQAWQQRLQRRGIAHNHDFLGVYDFAGGTARYAELLRQWFSRAGRASLLMCHPSCEPIPGDAICTARQVEYQVWRSPELDAWLQHSGCRIVTGAGPAEFLPPGASAPD